MGDHPSHVDPKRWHQTWSYNSQYHDEKPSSKEQGHNTVYNKCANEGCHTNRMGNHPKEQKY